MSHQVDYRTDSDYKDDQVQIERLKQLRYEAADTQKDWVDTFKDGETRSYRFVYDERTKYTLKHFKEGDEGRWVMAFRVMDLNNPEQLKYGKDKEFILAKTHSVAVLDELLKGNYDLEITRHGSSNFGTRYEVKPIPSAK